MKIYHLLLGAALCGSLTSCFKDEPLNAECDIEQAYVQIDDPTEIFYQASDTLVNVQSNETSIVFEITDKAEITTMAPVFRLTEGATIEPANGSEQDFSDGREVAYTVTSQDGAWRRTYHVSFRVLPTPAEYSFENMRLVDGAAGGQYYEWSDLTEEGNWIGDWATGNSGFNLSAQLEGGTTPPEYYPSSPVDGGVSGKAVKLETKDTGGFGTLFGMGIAAGNLFIGKFDAQKALTVTEGAMQATSFGRSFDHEPVSLTGWYKYKSGGECIDGRHNPIKGKYDRGDIYAVLYRNHDAAGDAFTLHGDDVKTSPQIVAIAQVPEINDTEEWTEFRVDFDYREPIDRELLERRGYNIAVVCTSSIEGATFKGALGSTLHVDEIKVICAPKTE